MVLESSAEPTRVQRFFLMVDLATPDGILEKSYLKIYKYKFVISRPEFNHNLINKLQ